MGAIRPLQEKVVCASNKGNKTFAQPWLEIHGLSGMSLSASFVFMWMSLYISSFVKDQPLAQGEVLPTAVLTLLSPGQ